MSNPPLPPAPPPGPPLGSGPETIPGSTKGAVVLLWILFGFGICGGALSVFGYTALVALEDTGDVVIPSSFMPFLIASIVQILIWTVLRAIFAVRIAKRSAGARKGAIILELVGLALAVVSWIFTPEVEVTGASTAGNTAGTVIGAVIGIALAAIIIGLLSTADSKRWCNE
ncbi:hypothetical protein [Glycomyces tritici]|uniref:DUF2975 domain-containing protein n=1 Tax=Glycomyces tritici TaxID=2665176 RepID=A0ABT7YXK4_9ACTN|nr:hypothetical protein [Glycomyces tritici]MDN3241321.1 hypothetical protein [Glycomyces tritici]MDN3243344.1 hypothetical protein [Glycomyces tritici]